MSNQIESARKKSLANFFNTPKISTYLEGILEDNKLEFVSNLLSLTDSDPKLALCDPAALMNCAMNAVALDLPLNKNLGFAYVIPYKNNKLGIIEPQFQIGAKGFKQLAMKSGQYKTINNCEVREGELTTNKFTGEYIVHEENPEGKIVGYFAHFELKNGYKKCLYMTNAQLEAHAMKYVPSYRSDKTKGWTSSKWSTDERHSMCMKTVIKLLLSREGLLSTKMANAINAVDNNETFEKQDNNDNIQDAVIIEQESEPETVQI